MVLTDLNGTTWYFNETLDLTGTDFAVTVDFRDSANYTYNQIGLLNGIAGYYDVQMTDANSGTTYTVYRDGTWNYPECRLITFTSTCNTVQLIEWIQNNATQITVNITDLTGTKWRFNETVICSFLSTTFNITFISEHTTYQNCDQLMVQKTGSSQKVAYRPIGATSCYEVYTAYSGWVDAGARNIEITGGNDVTSMDLIAWLLSNAVWVNEPHDVTVLYNELPIASLDDTGTKTLLTAGKYCQDNIVIDYTKPTPNLQSKSTSPTTSSQTITADSGYDGLSQVTVNAISPTKSAQTYTPTTTDQTIASGRWLTGAQTIKGDANLVASNIASGVSIFGVTGTHSGGGSSEDLNKIITRTVTSVINSEVNYVGAYAFANCTSLTTASFPSCQVISSFAFQNCEKLTTISFPACVFIYSSAFGRCYSLASVNFPSCQSIANYAFYNCSKLSIIDFPACKTIGVQAFANCSSLTTVNFPSCSSINTYAFQSCFNLTTISFPAQSGSLGNYAFAKCSKLASAVFSSCTYIGTYAFSYCSKLSIISFPICKQIGSLAFTYCLSLTTISFPSCSKIWNSAFYSCWNLVSLYLTGSSVAALASSNAFNSTPIAGYTTSTGGVYGSIFVPSSLYNTYISSTNWVYFSSRFVSV